ncbi:hypothetical protein [Sphingopyxis fribergensis]|uniref:hypothetical protein n=1 Tax=Sphingopyxis fribergensis TaxID=1515612 RepID=UPI0011DDE204|nr:hypothetical protein [Sphingopyxis fribergensis]
MHNFFSLSASARSLFRKMLEVALFGGFFLRRLFLPMVVNVGMTARAPDMLQSSKIGGMKGSNTKTGENVAWSGVRQWMSLLPLEPNPIVSSQRAASAG